MSDCNHTTSESCLRADECAECLRIKTMKSVCFKCHENPCNCPQTPSEPPVRSSELVRLLREMQEGLTEDARKELWYEITEGYCSECGRPDPQYRCQCWNDE